MSSQRRKAREFCLQILFQSNFQAKAPATVLPQFFREYPNDPQVTEYAKCLSCGVWEHKAEIDRIIEAASDNWKLSRMSEVDLTILRMATYEMRYLDDVPTEVSLNEAIEIAKKFGSEDSSAFVNGILDKIAKT